MRSPVFLNSPIDLGINDNIRSLIEEGMQRSVALHILQIRIGMFILQQI